MKVVKLFGFLYRRLLTLRHLILSVFFRPYIAWTARNKSVKKEPYDFGNLYASLTTYPARINDCYYTICSILSQRTPVNKIVVTLTKEEFPSGERDIPERILNLKEKGVEFIWADTNLKPHNKYFHIMQKYPEATIITIDDDIIYSRSTFSKLVNSYQKNSKAIIALCTDRFLVKDNEILPYSESMHCYDSKINEPRMDLCANGFAGVLYPPSILPQETFNVDAIKKCAPIADDIWLKYMEIMGKVSVVCACSYKDPIVIPDGQSTALLNQNNLQNQNDVQQKNIEKFYSNFDFVKMIKNEN
ncbi:MULTISPECIES: glycosyltransferase [unclassified Fibrobacter]|uniref:glycosyltransferase n=1 Tax=unclassified Fibrobacter TaxID=2634177 RepID=UPI001304B089|nr:MULTISPECIES: glycosyltransferase [unclassified Fibrobacter]